MAVRSKTTRVLGLILGLLLLAAPVRGQEPDPVVHVVLFYSPTCAHCHEVITNFLLPLQEEYGSRLVILGFDTSQQWANTLYWEALKEYEVPEDQWAVPFMIVEETILVGGFEIPDQLPAIMERGLAEGGIDLPNFPALLTLMAEEGMLDTRYPDRRIALLNPQSVPDQAEADTEAEGAPPIEDTSTVVTDQPQVADSVDEVSAAGQTVASGDEASPEAPQESESPNEAPVSPPPSESAGPLGLAEAVREMESMTLMDRFKQDTAGNSVAVLVLLGMLVSLLLRAFPGRGTARPWPLWVVPALVVIGIGVASYLSFIEITHTEAVCGPVGDCNTVNQSKYAMLFGFLPVGILGLIGYALILLLWGLRVWGPASARDPVHLGLWGASLFGTAFSVYLTFLEPFVIGATCAWCLSSAVIMTLLLWATYPLAAQSWPGSTE